MTFLTMSTLFLGVASSLALASPPGIWTDITGDAEIRRTDVGNDAPLPPGFVPIDLLAVGVEGWLPSSPTTDRYAGAVVQGEANFVRVQVILAGLVTPPGPMGLSGHPYNPYMFGDRPITGFIELDIDEEYDTGGELMPIAAQRYLANIGRFGKSPTGSIDERIAQSDLDLDSDFSSDPQIERTGSEFTLALCGCFTPTIASQDGNLDSIFDYAETWVVEGRFFERFQSFQPAGATYGGSDFGLFDPITALQFSHDPMLDQTTITLVFPITNAGAALLAGEPEQPIDLDLSNHTSIEEAIDDLIIGADYASGDLDILTDGWRDEDYTEYRVPTDWTVSALIGTAPLVSQPLSFYVWTDTGFNELTGDLNLDGINDSDDAQALDDFISDNDGSGVDSDGIVNNQIGVVNFGHGFQFFDLNHDGVVSVADTPTVPCQADLNDDGTLDFFDVSAFLMFFGAADPLADFNADGSLDFFDVSEFLTEFAAGCP